MADSPKEYSAEWWKQQQEMAKAAKLAKSGKKPAPAQPRSQELQIAKKNENEKARALQKNQQPAAGTPPQRDTPTKSVLKKPASDKSGAIVGTLKIHKDGRFLKNADVRMGVNRIGRISAGNDIVMGFMCLSRKHCEIVCREDGNFLQDVKSTNKTRWALALNDKFGSVLPPNKLFALKFNQWFLVGGEVACQFVEPEGKEEQPDSAQISKSVTPSSVKSVSKQPAPQPNTEEVMEFQEGSLDVTEYDGNDPPAEEATKRPHKYANKTIKIGRGSAALMALIDDEEEEEAETTEDGFKPRQAASEHDVILSEIERRREERRKMREIQEQQQEEERLKRQQEREARKEEKKKERENRMKEFQEMEQKRVQDLEKQRKAREQKRLEEKKAFFSVLKGSMKKEKREKSAAELEQEAELDRQEELRLKKREKQKEEALQRLKQQEEEEVRRREEAAERKKKREAQLMAEKQKKAEEIEQQLERDREELKKAREERQRKVDAELKEQEEKYQAEKKLKAEREQERNQSQQQSSSQSREEKNKSIYEEAKAKAAEAEQKERERIQNLQREKQKIKEDQERKQMQKEKEEMAKQLEEYKSKVKQDLKEDFEKASFQTPTDLEDTSGPILDFEPFEGAERAVKWEFDADSTAGQWKTSYIFTKMDAKPFAEGSIRYAYKLREMNNPSLVYVAKISKSLKDPRSLYFDDIRMQMTCKHWAEEYNKQDPPKKVDFLPGHVLEFLDRPKETRVFSVEPMLPDGEFIKHNNNSGGISSERNTPQTFSHFTYEHSNHEELVIDVQGVADLYTDPQIHSTRDTKFGIGNLGERGISKFVESHECNVLCEYLSLPKIGKKTINDKAGTMPKPKLGKGADLVAMDGNGNGASAGTPVPSRSKSAPVHQSIDLMSFELGKTMKGEREFKSIASKGNVVYAACSDKTIVEWKVDQPRNSKQTIYGHNRPVEAVCVGGQYLFSGGCDELIKVWSLRNLKHIHNMKDHEGEVWVLRSSGTHLFSGSGDKTIKMWDADSFDIKATFKGHTRAIKGLCVSQGNIFSGSNDKTVKVWDINTKKETYTLKGHTQWVTCVATAGNYLFTGSNDKSIKIWDLKSLECTATLRGHEDWVNDIYVTPQCIISASEDHSVKIWDLATLRCMETLDGHGAGVSALTLTPSFLATASQDCTLKTWNYSAQ